MTVMHFQSNQRQTIDLGNGQIMRWSTAADTENLQKLLSEAFRVKRFCSLLRLKEYGPWIRIGV